MPAETLITASTVKAVGTHVAKWLNNLWRAGQQRQLQSLGAIAKVIPALRKTEAYCRGLAKGDVNHSTEAELAFHWSALAAELEMLELKALAKKCDMKGRYWANPDQFSPEFLQQADIGLKSVERLARELRAKVTLGQLP